MERSNQQRGIKEWETLESVSESKQALKIDGRDVNVSAQLEVKSPVFHDGNRGRPVLELTLQKDRWSFRFRISREGDSEAEKAVEVIQAVLQNKAEAVASLEKHYKQYETAREADRAKRIEEHEKNTAKFVSGRGDDKSGKGLGRWSKPGKTKRHRDKGSPHREDRD